MTMKKIIASLAVFTALVIGAQAQQTWLVPNVYTNLTLPATIAASATNNLTAATMIVNPGDGMAFEASWYSAGASSVAAQTFTAQATIDNTNFYTVGTFSFATSAGATNDVGTNLPAAWFDGAYKVKISSWASADTNAITPVKAVLSRKRLDY